MAFALSCLQLLHQLVLHGLILFLQISFTDEIHRRLRVMLRRLHWHVTDPLVAMDLLRTGRHLIHVGIGDPIDKVKFTSPRHIALHEVLAPLQLTRGRQRRICYFSVVVSIIDFDHLIVLQVAWLLRWHFSYILLFEQAAASRSTVLLFQHDCLAGLGEFVLGRLVLFVVQALNLDNWSTSFDILLLPIGNRSHYLSNLIIKTI